MTALRAAVELKLAVAEDAPLLARIHRDARTAAMPWLPVLHSKDEDLAWMTNIVLAKQQVVAATHDAGVVGFIAVTDGWVEHLYVAPSSWRTGVGSVLLRHAMELQPNGFRLWTFRRNTMARNFYGKHGLTEIRWTDGHENEEKEPDVLLGWKLTS
jgi:GNAT superfamily N-acetyltransferase